MTASDIQFYELFKAQPELLKDFAGLTLTDTLTFESITLKKMETRIDGYFKTENPQSPDFVVEFQGYHNENHDVYNRTILAMCLLKKSLAKIAKPLRGIIIFTHPKFDKKTDPWHYLTTSKDPHLVVLYLEDVLKSLAKRHPEHPVAPAFAPFLATDSEKLAEQAPSYFRQICASDASPKLRDVCLQIFESFLLSTLGSEKFREVRKMYGITRPFSESPGFQDMFAIAKTEGRKEGKMEGKIEGKIEGKEETRAENLAKYKALLDQGIISKEAYIRLCADDQGLDTP